MYSNSTLADATGRVGTNHPCHRHPVAAGALNTVQPDQPCLYFRTQSGRVWRRLGCIYGELRSDTYSYSGTEQLAIAWFRFAGLGATEQEDPAVTAHFLSMVAVGTIITDRPRHRIIRLPPRRISERCCYSHTAQSLEHSFPALCRGWCWTERCSPWPAAFSPQAPPKIALHCSSGSSKLWRGPAPRGRACPMCGSGPRQTGLVPLRGRGAPHVVSQRARVLRLHRTDCSLAIIAKQPCRPPPIRSESASWFRLFRSSIARPTDAPGYTSSSISRTRSLSGMNGEDF